MIRSLFFFSTIPLPSSLPRTYAHNNNSNKQQRPYYLFLVLFLMTLLLLLLRPSSSSTSSSVFLSTICRRHHLHKSSSSSSSSSLLLFQLSHHKHQNQNQAASSSSINIRRRGYYSSSSSHNHNHNHINQKPKIVVIMGPTGSGKSRLSIHLASRFFPTSEIINSDKIQVYSGLDITTNKIPIHQRLGVTHHLLGHFHPSHSRPEFTPSDFRAAASSAISLISNRRNLPLIVGGSNSFIYSLIASDENNNIDILINNDIPHDHDHVQQKQQQQQQQRYRCCFIRIDVSFPVLNRYLVKRVDDMMGCGMLEELMEFFKSKGFLGKEEEEAASRVLGLRKAIGVAELEPYFRRVLEEGIENRRALEEGIENIKRNTCELARRQVDKMRWLTNGAGGGGWKIHKVEGTEAMRAMIAAGEGRFSGEEATEIWETHVLRPSVKIVKQFLDE